MLKSCSEVHLCDISMTSRALGRKINKVHACEQWYIYDRTGEDTAKGIGSSRRSNIALLNGVFGTVQEMVSLIWLAPASYHSRFWRYCGQPKNLKLQNRNDLLQHYFEVHPKERNRRKKRSKETLFNTANSNAVYYGTPTTSRIHL